MICRICGKPLTGTRCLYCNKAVVRYKNATAEVTKDNVAATSGEVVETAATPVGAQAQVQTVRQKNGLALAGLILSFFGYTTIIGLILSIVGLVKSKSLNGEGKGTAIAGIVISSLALVSVAVYLVYMFRYVF